MNTEAERTNTKHEIKLKIDREWRAISLNDIIYIQSLGNYIKVYTPTRRHLCLLTTRHIEESLPETEFIRVHKSFIINRTKITAINESTIVLSEHLIPIGKTYKQYVHHLIRKTHHGV